VLDRTILEPFLTSFFGYGRLKSRLWFIGLEEGGGTTENEISARLQAWHTRGRRRVEDVRAFHLACDTIQAEQRIRHAVETRVTNRLGRPFAKKALLQFTWERLIRTIRANKALSADVDEMRKYQINGFARFNDCVASLELFPLPSPRSQAWNYGPVSGRSKDPQKAFPARRWTDLYYLQDRTRYHQKLRDHRISILRQMIAQYEPDAVVFYGEGRRNDWAKISDTKIRPGDYTLKGRGRTRFMLLPHPNARRNIPGSNTDLPETNLLFTRAGETLRRHRIVLD
jgi:hypothetical protein